MAKKKRSAKVPGDLRDLLRVSPGLTQPSDYPTDGAPGAPGGRVKTLAALAEVSGPAIGELQERFYAASTVPGDLAQRRVLLVLQGMDTSGKGE